MMYAKEEGERGRPRGLWRSARDGGRAKWCRSRPSAGIDIINDGEMSKPSYATYIKDRLNGFGGTGNTFVYQDLADFPEAGQARLRRSGPLAAQDAGAATAPISVRDRDGVRPRHRQSESGARRIAACRAAFMSAASPGVISLFFHNDYYPSHERLSRGDRGGDEAGIRGDRGRRLRCCRSIAPIWRWAAISSTLISSSAEFRKRAADARRGAQSRAREYPRRAAADARVLGQLRGAAPLRRAARRHHRHRASRPGPHAISFEAANPRHAHEWTLYSRR